MPVKKTFPEQEHTFCLSNVLTLISFHPPTPFFSEGEEKANQNISHVLCSLGKVLIDLYNVTHHLYYQFITEIIKKAKRTISSPPAPFSVLFLCLFFLFCFFKMFTFYRSYPSAGYILTEDLSQYEKLSSYPSWKNVKHQRAGIITDSERKKGLFKLLKQPVRSKHHLHSCKL